MKNILQKIFLFFALLLFGWGYGQNSCFSTDKGKILSPSNYPGAVVNVTGLMQPGGFQSYNNNNLTTPDNLIDNLTSTGLIFNNRLSPLGSNTDASITVSGFQPIPGNHLVMLDYSVGSIDPTGLLNGSAKYTITTRLNGVTTNSFNKTESISISLGNKLQVISPTPFNEIVIRIEREASLIQNTFSLNYIEIIPPCEPIVCNKTIPLTKEYFGESLTTSSLGFAANSADLINSDTTDFGVLSGIGSLTIKSENDFDAGTYVGFVLQDVSLAEVYNGLSITTYKDGVEQDVFNNSNLGIGLLSTGARNFGFVTEKSFDEVKLTMLSLGLGATNVYYGFIIEPCDNDYEFVCNENTSIKQSEFAAVINSERSGITGALNAGNIFVNPSNVIDSDTNNYATLGSAAGAVTTSGLAVKIVGDPIPGGYFAGFLIENTSLVDLTLLDNITIRTYLNGNEVENASGSILGLNLQIFPGTNKRYIGFNTSQGKDFDEIVFESYSTAQASIGLTNIYEAVVRKNCFGPDLSCNTDTRLTLPEYPVSISSRTGFNGTGIVGQINNADNALNNDPTSFATISITTGALGSANFAVQTGNQVFDGGTFAGFEVESTSLLDVGLLNDITINTYLNGTLQESSNSGNLLLDVGAIGSTPKAIIGFETTLPFNEVEYRMGVTVNLDLLGETRIYNLVLKKFCEPSEPLVCNELRTLKEQEFPVSAYTKVSSAANVSLIGDLIQDIGNLLDNNTDNFVTLNPTVSALTELTIGVNKAGLPFKPGTYAEFEVQSSNLIDASLLSNFSVRLINKEGVTVETISSNSLLLGVGLFQFGAQETQKIGFKSTVEFSKAELVYSIPVSATLGTTRIYRFNVMETCPIELVCNDSDPITTVDRPVIINAINTGTAGLACVGCSVNNPENLIDGDLTNFTRLVVAAGVAARNAVSVKDLANIYPAGSSVGFATSEANPILNLDLLNTIRVTTYLNGQMVESVSGASLINLNALFIQIFPQNQVYGFRTTSKFDEVQISIGSLASLINVIDLSSLVISTQGANDPDLDFVCPNGICVKPGNTEGPGLPTLTGISTLQNTRNTWPTDIPNGFIALESKNKGMVISRVANTDAIATPLEGMLIYDVSANCVKLYNGTTWKCLEQSCNE